MQWFQVYISFNISEAENIDCEAEPGIEVTRNFERVTHTRHKNIEESMKVQRTESQQISDDDSNLGTVEIQNVIDEIDGNIRNYNEIGSKNLKRAEGSKLESTDEGVEGDGMKNHAGSQISDIDSIMDEDRKR